MSSTKYHLAQVNIGRMRAPLESDVMRDFVARLDEINQLAETAPGFVWRFQTDEGNATAMRPYEDDRILFNLSVWESIEALKDYVYRSAHVEVMKRRREWFEKFDGVFLALWWVPVGHLPSVEEAKARLEELHRHGASERVFTFQQPFPPPDESAASLTLTPFTPCPAL
jgi:heme-degrading monooxygenase HmoA